MRLDSRKQPILKRNHTPLPCLLYTSSQKKAEETNKNIESLKEELKEDGQRNIELLEEKRRPLVRILCRKDSEKKRID